MIASGPVTCWNCGNSTEQIHFCDSCQCLQPPSPDYYDFFGIERKLNLDLADLERRFYALSRRLHPDLYCRRGPRERQFSLDATAILNDAYRTLKDPAARAEYLLQTEGFEPAGERVPAELLEEAFAWNMAREQAGAAELEAARLRFAAMLAGTGRELKAAFRAYDEGGGREALARIRGLLDRRRYLERLL